MVLEQHLQEFGLTQKESKLYLTSLQAGPTNIQQLSKKTKIKRSTLYEVISNLTEKNLLIKTRKKKRDLYMAQEPKNMILMIKQKEELIAKILPELEALRNDQTQKPLFKIFEGAVEIKRLYEEMLAEKPTEILAMAASDENISRTIYNYLSFQWKSKRIKNKIPIKILLRSNHENPEKRYEKIKIEEELREVCFLPKINYPFTVGIYIYDNNIAFVSFKEEEMFASVIRSTEISNSFRLIFHSFWR